jgi:ADP-heptose:LPS heptosyltransferase
LLNISSTQFYSLQTGQILDELANFDEFGSIFDLEPQINSFYDTARLISGLDLIITVETALAHLAGAMGKPVLILLATCADWRWQSKAENIDNNLWYQSARLFRQLSPGEWSDPLHDVETHIPDLIL